MLPHNAGVKLSALPGGLITRPTLMWELDAQRPARIARGVSYQTNG
jgi:hypothetical protein